MKNALDATGSQRRDQGGVPWKASYMFLHVSWANLEKNSINKWSGFSQAERTEKIQKKEKSAHRYQNKNGHAFGDSQSFGMSGAECVSWGRVHRLKDDKLCVQSQGVCNVP